MAREFRIPGKLFAVSVSHLREDLLRVLDSNDEEFPIRRIFDFISLTDNNHELENKLIARGSFVRMNGAVFLNQARLPLSERAKDIGPDLDGLNLYVPRVVELKLEYVAETDMLTITPVQEGRRILVLFDTAPVPGFGTTFVLSSIEVDAAGLRYRFHEELDEQNRVDIYVDMELEASVYAGRRSNFPSYDKPVLLAREFAEGVSAAKALGLAFSSCPCDCCNLPCYPRRAICPPGHVKLNLSIRAVIVVARATEAGRIKTKYQRWMAATQRLFGQASNIDIVDGGMDVVVDPAFLDIDASPCNCREQSKDTLALFDRHYGKVQENTIVAFVLRSLSGITIGCAAHPDGRPGFTMERRSPAWVHAHEVGHVLGLSHVENQDNLMWRKTDFTNPPPDLNASQIRDIRCSPYNSEPDDHG